MLMWSEVQWADHCHCLQTGGNNNTLLAGLSWRWNVAKFQSVTDPFCPKNNYKLWRKCSYLKTLWSNQIQSSAGRVSSLGRKGQHWVSVLFSKTGQVCAKGGNLNSARILPSFTGQKQQRTRIHKHSLWILRGDSRKKDPEKKVPHSICELCLNLWQNTCMQGNSGIQL